MNNATRIGVLLQEGRCAHHFGRSTGILLCEVDGNAIGQIRTLDRHRHRPVGGCETLPDWLVSLGVQVVLTGGIGGVALQRLTQAKVRVVGGVGGQDPEEAVRAFVANPAAAAPTPCDHHEHEHHHCHAGH